MAHYTLNLDDPNATWVRKADLANPRNHTAGAVINGLVLSWTGPPVRRKWSGMVGTLASAAAFAAAVGIFFGFRGLLGDQPYRDFLLYSWIRVEGGLLDIPFAARLDLPEAGPTPPELAAAWDTVTANLIRWRDAMIFGSR